MVFSSIPFLYYFLPVALLLYFIAPRFAKNAVLLFTSLVFYGWGEPKYLVLMVFTIITSYVLGLLTEKYSGKKLSKFFTVVAVVLDLSILGVFKYFDFFVGSINKVTGFSIPFLRLALPIGISFYTFQCLSYVIDVYRGDVKAQRNIITLGTFITMFPQLIAGPIVRYSDIEEQLTNRTFSLDRAATGVRRFVVGLSKKVLIANVLGELVAKLPEKTSFLFFLLYCVAFTLQIYFDFSGYSDMAIGLGKILGFDFNENFNYPYVSKSITEFWRRWHMSLGTWFRDYVYIPLGGNRVSKPRWFLNIFIVWGLTGLWHGADWSFVLWGLFYGILLVLEKLFLLKALEKTKVICHIYTIILTVVGFTIFNMADVSVSISGFSDPAAVYYLKSYLVVLIVGIICATPLLKILYAKLLTNKIFNKVSMVVEPLVLLGLMVLVTAFLADSSFNPFLYFRF